MCRKKENVKIQVLFKVYGSYLGTFQDKFGFQELFKLALHFQVLSSLCEPGSESQTSDPSIPSQKL